MKTLQLKPLALALAGALAISQTALAAAPAGPQQNLREEITTAPGRSITAADEALVSSSAGKVVYHITHARDAIRKQEGERAKQELRQAETLLDIIQSTLPTTIVKDRIWTSDNKLQYQNSAELAPTSVPISATLNERVEFDRAKLAKAKTATPGSEKTAEEAEDSALYYEEVDLPLNATRHFVASAQVALGKHRFDDADQALRAALDNVDFTAIYVPEPLLTARINLERAHAHFSANNLVDAKADLGRAITQLGRVEQQAGPETKADVQKLLADAKSLQARIDQGGPKLGPELKSLWHHTKALAERAEEYTTVGWAKLRNHSQLRGDLIEAKRYVDYADIEANVANDPTQTRQYLQKAKDWLVKAAADATDNSEAGVYIKDARAVVDTLLAGQAKADAGELGNLKSQLAQQIDKL